MSNLYKHQQDLIDLNPSKRLVAFGCGCGKTRTVLELARKNGWSVLVAAPKTQALDKTWEREALKIGFNLPLTVISKEKFRKDWKNYKADCLILDESHCFTGVSSMTRYRKKIEIPRASQMFEAVEAWITENKPQGLYLCSATPFPQPMALYAIMKLFGEEMDYFAFRRRFYSFVPSIGRGVWLPKKDKISEQELVSIAKKYGTFGRLQDFTDVPEQTHKPVEVGMTPVQKRLEKELSLLYPEPIVRIGKRHQVEQGLFEQGEPVEEWKTSEIVALADEFDKLLVFARYTKQIDMLEKKLKKEFKGRDILVLDGRSVNRRDLLTLAEDPNRKTIILAQTQVSTGYELPSFRCTVFASMSYSFVDHTQAIGRTLRINALAKNVYIYLLSGEIDKAVHACIERKNDFNELLFAKNI